MPNIQELQHLSLATTYEIDDSFDSDKFIKMRLRVCHDGVNPNSSCFEVENMEDAKDSIVNIPILANVIFDENGVPQFGSHDMLLEENKVKEGEFKLIYIESPIGLVPENCNHTIEKFNDKNYVFVDCYIWKEYSNYAQDIIERDKDIKLSMEILVDSFEYNSKDKCYKVNDYRYTGITFLNNNCGTGMENALGTTGTFELNNSKEKFIIMMEELKETLNQYNIKNNQEGGIDILTEKFELIKKYENLTEEDVLELKENHEQYSLEDFDMKLKELSEAKNNPNPPVTDFTLTHEQLEDEIRKVLRNETVVVDDYWGDPYERQKYYYRDIKENIIIVESYEWYTYFGIPFTTNNDSVLLDFDNMIEYLYDWRPKIDGEVVNNFAKQDFENELKVFANKATEKAKTEVIAEYELKVKEVQDKLDTTTTEYSNLNTEFENLKIENISLSEFKLQTEKSQQEAFEFQQSQLKTELIENFSKVLSPEEIKSVEDKNLSLSDMETEFKLIYADKDLQTKFSKKTKKPEVETEIPIVFTKKTNNDSWTSCIKKEK